MRNVVGGFGLLCGIIVIGLVGRYGFKTTDIDADAWIMAFLFAAIATGGLFGHAVAARLWRHNKAASAAMGAVSAVALMLNLSNSLGAIAGRADHATMERVGTNRAIRAAEEELKRLSTLLDKMPAFVRTDDAALSAAKSAADAAASARLAECGNGDPKQRGRFCREKEGAEKVAIDALSEATKAKAATDRANALESGAEIERKKLSNLGPIVTENVQGSAIAKLFRLPDKEADFVAMAQQFGIAVVVELIIVMCLIAWEVLGHAHANSMRATAARTSNAEVSREKPIDLGSADRIETKPRSAPPRAQTAAPFARTIPRSPAIREQPQNAPAKLPPPSRPTLAIARQEPPAGPVPRIMTGALEPAKGERLELGKAYSRYVAVCKAEARAAVTPNQFMDAMAKFCKQVGIKSKIENEKLYLIDIELSAPPATAEKIEEAAG